MAHKKGTWRLTPSAFFVADGGLSPVFQGDSSTFRTAFTYALKMIPTPEWWQKDIAALSVGQSYFFARAGESIRCLFVGNTYRRLHEGDRRCSEEDVRRMFAEQVEDCRDERILPNYDFADIDPDSLRIYRQMLSDIKPGHPALELQGIEFLRQIGGWRKDRVSGVEGLTLAGLLMFGRWLSIQESVPHYFVDYQERPHAKTELRWVDRLVPDGTWSGNLFDFYRRVYRKLVEDLRVLPLYRITLPLTLPLKRLESTSF